jgi:hypothetical protein
VCRGRELAVFYGCVTVLVRLFQGACRMMPPRFPQIP